MCKDLNSLRLRVSEYLSEYRYKHTLGVEKMAMLLGEILLPESTEDLRAAALLHDVAKELSHQEQLKLIREYGIPVSDEDISTEPALHSFAACAIIKRDFPQYSGAEIISAVYNHTLGAPSMSLFDKIIYISDYVEIGRTYPESVRVREYLMNAISRCSREEMIASIDAAIVVSIDNTIKHLTEKGQAVNSKTLHTKSSLQA